MKVVHEGGPWTQSRWWSMDWGSVLCIYPVNHAGLDYYNVGWHKYSLNTEEHACKKLTCKKLQPEFFAIRYPDIQ